MDEEIEKEKEEGEGGGVEKEKEKGEGGGVEKEEAGGGLRLRIIWLLETRRFCSLSAMTQHQHPCDHKPPNVIDTHTLKRFLPS